MRRAAGKTLRLFGIIGAVGLVGCGESEGDQSGIDPSIRPVRTITVGDIDPTVRGGLTGRAEAAREVSLGFRVPGDVLAITVSVGEEVVEGQIVAMLDPATFETEVARLDANRERALASHTNAEGDAERDRILFSQGHIAQARLDETEAVLAQAVAEVAATEAALRQAQLDLDYTQLHAPFDGVIVATYVEAFEDVGTNEAVLRLLDPSRIEMTIDVPETLISQLPFVGDIIVTFDALPGIELPAEITEVGTEASNTTRTFPVTLTMDQPDGARILPGMAGLATPHLIEMPEGRPLIVPVGAIVDSEDGTESLVWIVDPGSQTVSQQPVRLGEIIVEGVIVTEGLKIGDIVVTAGVHSLQPGQRVRLLSL